MANRFRQESKACHVGEVVLTFPDLSPRTDQGRKMQEEASPQAGSFGKRLRTLRENAGLTQQQVAASLNVTRPSVTQWEADVTTPSLPKIRALAELLSVNVDDLIGDDASEFLDIHAIADRLRQARIATGFPTAKSSETSLDTPTTVHELSWGGM